MDKITHILHVLGRHRLPLENEKHLQEAIAGVFNVAEIPFIKEHRLDDQNIPDFFIEGIAIEVKISGSSKRIMRQCERYCKFPSVTSLILVSNKPMGFPKQLAGKDCYVLNLSRSWL